MRRSKGFTLVEAAVAIGVVAILSGIIIPLVLKSIKDSRNARAQNDLQVIAQAIASQLKDTGSRRPCEGPAAGGAAPTPGGASGAGDAIWYSRGNPPRNFAGLNLFVPGTNTFEHLFTPDSNAEANTLFGLHGAPAEREFQFRGPYLARQIANTTDPWGNAYLIIGYNANGQVGHGRPIWVVCAGESERINPVNLAAAAGGGAVQTWNYTGRGATNMVVQVN